MGVQPFDSKDAMRELRKAHAGTHAFNRVSVEQNGKKLDLIYTMRLDGAACTIAPETKKIRLRENLGVARQLVNESFIASFAGKAGRKIVDVGPLKVLSSEKDHDFIAQAVNGATVPPWLTPLTAHGVMPFFGVFLSGGAGHAVLPDLRRDLRRRLGLCGGLIYHLKPAGWWLILVVWVLSMISALMTFTHHAMLEMYHLIYPQAQID